jgi:N-methylhydantoinase A/oxoprolinase/acetone carboxylase beta subunit
MYSLGIDIGGTFTDFTLVDGTGSDITIDKELTTPDNPAVAALEGARRLLSGNGVEFEDLETIIHGTTLVSNTIIAKTGAATGLLTTTGARDVLQIRRGWRYDVYDWQLEYPPPLVPRYRTLELDERIDADGAVVTPVDRDEIRAQVERLVENHDVESVAVSLLHAYESDEHERQVADVIAAEYPDTYVSLSSEVAPIIREYERTSTTVLNAYVAPVLDAYLDCFKSELRAAGFSGSIYLMTSSGGIVDVDTAKTEPVRLVESGPAAGVLVNRMFGEAHGASNVFSFDMGGTTAKGSIIKDGEIEMTYHADIAREHRFKSGSGYDLIAPMIDMTEIGAGGGSIASIDEMTGLVDVGPESAGSDPGPICYDQGGTTPTVTDAALLLGFLHPDRFMGGRLDLAASKTRRIFRESLADPLDVSIEEAAWQVLELVSENMANAFRQHTASKGIDPSGLSMVAIGGAGPMTAFSVAEKVGLRDVICPFKAGVGSSIGLITAPKRYQVSSTRRSTLSDVSADAMVEEFEELYEQAATVLERAGADPTALVTEASLDMRHINQGHEIEVSLEGTSIDEVTPETARERFRGTYRERFNRDILDLRVEIINYRVAVHEPAAEMGVERLEEDDSAEPHIETRPLYFGNQGEVEADVYRWAGLSPGDSVAGPAVVEADQTTAILSPESRADVMEGMGLRVALEGVR